MTVASEQVAPTQPSAPPDQSTASTPEGGSQTGDNLDSLLAEYSSTRQATSTEPPKPPEPTQAETPPASPPAPPALSADDRSALAAARDIKAEREAEKFKADIDSAVKAVKEHDDLKGLPDRLVRGALHDLAAEDPRFRQAFMQRHEDPVAWKKVLKAASSELAKEVGDIGSRSISNDRAAVLAAGRTTQAAPPVKQVTNAEISKMSRRQFEDYKSELKAQARR